MLPPRLSVELELLGEDAPTEVVEEGGFAHLIFRDFQTSAHFNSPSTTLLIRVPLSYPDAGLDMFWTDPALLHADGSVPTGAENMEPFVGRPWRRFSWHHNGWNATHNNLLTHLAFVRRRFHVR